MSHVTSELQFSHLDGDIWAGKNDLFPNEGTDLTNQRSLLAGCLWSGSKEASEVFKRSTVHTQRHTLLFEPSEFWIKSCNIHLTLFRYLFKTWPQFLFFPFSIIHLVEDMRVGSL